MVKQIVIISLLLLLGEIVNLKKHIQKTSISLDLKGETKEEIIRELVDLLSNSILIDNKETAINDILRRESKMSTGMQNGIALPHAKTEAVEGLVAAVGIKKDGIDFTSLDKQPSFIFVAILSPTNKSGPHIQFLAEISKLLLDNSVKEKFILATDPEEILSLFP